MTIEVKQLLIKSNIIQNGDSESDDNISEFQMDQLRADIIDECKRIIIDLLDEKSER